MAMTTKAMMKRMLLCCALVVLAPVLQAQSISGEPFIAAHGKARAEVVPDLFPLDITLKDTTLDGAETQALIEGYAKQVMDLTKAMGMDDRDVDVSNLSIAPAYRYDDQAETQIFLGNTYERRIGLRFRSLADLRKAIETLPKAKQVQLETGKFQSTKADELRRELLSAAVADARKTAEAMAKAVGRRVGPVHNVSNQGFNVRYVESGAPTELDSIMVSGTRLGAPTSSVALREGTIQLDQSVYIIYALVD